MGDDPGAAVGPAILLSSVGAKTALVDAVREAMNRQRGIERLLTADLNADAPGHRASDGRVSLPALAGDDALPSVGLATLLAARVTLVVPTRDGELLFWAEHGARLRAEGIEVVVSTPSTVRLALDKLAFAATGAAAGLSTVPTSDTLPTALDGPLVVKERFGAGSRSIALDVGPAQALQAATVLASPIFQPYLRGEEFSADAWVSRSGEVRGPVVRRRDTVIDGEAIVTTTVQDPQLEDVARSVLAWLPARGPVNVQLLRTEDGHVHIIELNARFGGASTCSVHAGLDVWAWELAEHRGLEPEPFWRIPGEVRQTRKRLPDGAIRDHIEHLGTGS